MIIINIPVMNSMLLSVFFSLLPRNAFDWTENKIKKSLGITSVRSRKKVMLVWEIVFSSASKKLSLCLCFKLYIARYLMKSFIPHWKKHISFFPFKMTFNPYYFPVNNRLLCPIQHENMLHNSRSFETKVQKLHAFQQERLWIFFNVCSKQSTDSDINMMYCDETCHLWCVNLSSSEWKL